MSMSPMKNWWQKTFDAVSVSPLILSKRMLLRDLQRCSVTSVGDKKADKIIKILLYSRRNIDAF